MTYPQYPNEHLFKQLWQTNTVPFVAILRGLTLDHAIPVAEVLVEAGFSYIEVPLNTPHAYEAIKRIKDHVPADIKVGAGTVLTTEQVDMVHAIGGEIIISPNMNADVIRRTKELKMISIPGVYTVTEAFNAIEAGADALKFFPAESVTPVIAKAMLTILPKGFVYLSVGGINPDSQQLSHYLKAGINGFGIGGSLYKPEYSIDQIKTNATQFMQAYKGTQ